MNISEEAIEAAAQAIYEAHEFPLHTQKSWSEMAQSSDRANRYRVARDRDYARAAITAALPYLQRA
ncbi:hypothetical protein [Aeromicrobium piscarium]|uniref:hypothetical protein n=1 Tax=Aeromicrobium piscarium TaxID=2590901 RepID=UPI001180C37F|nr:hypothetical protein [Aeromicrobium piscarium]